MAILHRFEPNARAENAPKVALSWSNGLTCHITTAGGHGQTLRAIDMPEPTSLNVENYVQLLIKEKLPRNERHKFLEPKYANQGY